MVKQKLTTKMDIIRCKPEIALNNFKFASTNIYYI